VAPPSRSAPHPWRALGSLIAVIAIMLFSILGSQAWHPGSWRQQFKVGLGLDLSSGTQVVLKAEPPNGKTPDQGEMKSAISVLLARVNGTGNSGAQVQQQGTDLINISVPGKAAQDVVNLISSTAVLAFRPVLLAETATPPAAPAPSSTPTGAPVPAPTGATSPSSSAGAAPAPSTGTSKPAAPAPSPGGSATAQTKAFITHTGPVAGPSATPGAASAAPASTGSAGTGPTGTAPTAGGTAAPAAATGGATPGNGATPPASPPPAATAPTPQGDPTKVSAANMKLFNEMKCTPSSNPNVVNESWKKSVHYAASGAQYNNMSAQVVSCDPTGTKYVLGPAVFTGKQISGVQATLQANSTQYVVDLTLDGKAANDFLKLTENQYNNFYLNSQSNPNDQVLSENAIVLDGDTQQAPQSVAAISGGQVEITGGGSGFTQDQANQLADVLKFGSLPLNFQQQSVSSISAQLGRESLDAGLIAGLIGLILVVIYLFMYYRGLGIVAVSSLLTASLLTYLSVVLLSRFQNFSLELASIVGLIVAVGITADSFIVFFERLRDEVREGKALRPAVESGWKRARRTILVSDTVSFLAAVLLYHFAVSDVQGFAYTLGLTTLVDVMVVFLFTKPMVTLLAGTKFFGGGHKWSGLDPARLGAKNPWRGQRRIIRNQRPAGARPATVRTSTARPSASGPSTPKEA
jgi:preprotein translocase subunit SecD